MAKEFAMNMTKNKQLYQVSKKILKLQLKNDQRKWTSICRRNPVNKSKNWSLIKELMVINQRNMNQNNEIPFPPINLGKKNIKNDDLFLQGFCINMLVIEL